MYLFVWFHGTFILSILSSLWFVPCLRLDSPLFKPPGAWLPSSVLSLLPSSLSFLPLLCSICLVISLFMFWLSVMSDLWAPVCQRFLWMLKCVLCVLAAASVYHLWVPWCWLPWAVSACGLQAFLLESSRPGLGASPGKRSQCGCRASSFGG